MEIIDYIEENLTENLNLDKIADIANYSKYHLHRMFTNIVGCTIHQYIQRRRLTEAARQLIFTDKYIIDIAITAGYSTHQSFTLAFRNLYKESPQVYRNKDEFYPIQQRFVLNLNHQIQSEKYISYANMNCKQRIDEINSYLNFNINCEVKVA
ncbi:TPA: helix-turn-helix transcriptional regulator [Clostridioides difficile]|nr:helix-turn-helix transcriptional regulator [Clostridioides difficile]EII6786389.1 helix-turn-helix transcriptional regulator [Clostridioides difficile]EIS9388835.1 helix-turn-helix transcriptional regulator [Clostridioides difficile]EIS9389404.1 helix-turn-helix transcriptional regulator [Clostridioides difficile]EIS9450731.1 helix-turn-helix transcriptional regulator [Clostridioides difficile]